MNLSKSGASLSVGPRGVTGTVSSDGVRGTVGIPGTGLFYTVERRSTSTRSRGTDDVTSGSIMPDRPDLGFLQRLAASPARRALVRALQAWHDGRERDALDGFERVAVNPGREPDVIDAAWFAALLRMGSGDADAAASWLTRVAGDLDALGRAVHALDVEPVVVLEVTDLVTVHVPPTRDAYHLASAEVHELRGENVEARRHLETLLAGDEANPLFLASWGDLILGGPHEPEDLQQVVARMATLRNDSVMHAVALLAKGRALANLGLFTAARDAFTMAYRKRKGRPPELLRTIRYERARVYASLGQKTRARREFEGIYAEDPAFMDVGARLGLTTA